MHIGRPSVVRILSTLTALLSVAAFAATANAANAAPNLPRAGLVMHLEADLGIQADGQKITNWWDQSGNGQNLQASGSPRLIAAGPNNQPVIEFAAADDQLGQTGWSNLPTHGNDRTLFVLSAPTNTAASFGYGNGDCQGNFALQHDRDGYSAISSGCADSPMHALGQVSSGKWRLQTLVVQSGTIYHLRDGNLVDGRSSRIDTRPGPFQINAPDIQGAAGSVGEPSSTIASSKLHIAAVLGYNWALGAAELDAVHSYLGSKWFNDANQFSSVPNLPTVTLPEPQLRLSQSTHSAQSAQSAQSDSKSLVLNWRASFADECGADNGWTNSRATSGSQIIPNPQPSRSYGLVCWHSRASSTQQFGANTQPLLITWQIPAGQQNLIDSYRVLLGTRSRDYKQVAQVSASTLSHTLNLAPGTYYLAMRTVSRDGLESDLSGELSLTVD